MEVRVDESEATGSLVNVPRIGADDDGGVGTAAAGGEVRRDPPAGHASSPSSGSGSGFDGRLLPDHHSGEFGSASSSNGSGTPYQVCSFFIPHFFVYFVILHNLWNCAFHLNSYLCCRIFKSFSENSACYKGKFENRFSN